MVEPITDVCPARLCPETRPPVRARLSALADDLTIVAEHLLLPDDLRDGLPSLDRGWLGFGSESEGTFAGIEARGSRDKLVGRLVERIRADDATAGFARVTAALDHPSARPPLVFMHSSLPHGPARSCPTAAATRSTAGRTPASRERWTRRQWLVDQAFQRHVLQSRYADALVGRLLNKVREAGLYDDAVILVTADHGVSFRAGEPRRRMTAATMPDVAVVQFIVKAPGSAPAGWRTARCHHRRAADDRRGRRGARAVDDGRDAGGPAAGGREHADRRHRRGQPGRAGGVGTVLDGRREREAAEARLLRGGEYAIGPRPDLIGRRAGDAMADGARATVDAPREYAAIAGGARVLPVLVSGDVAGLPDDEPIAIAVNGRVVATTRVFRLVSTSP